MATKRLLAVFVLLLIAFLSQPQSHARKLPVFMEKILFTITDDIALVYTSMPQNTDEYSLLSKGLRYRIEHSKRSTFIFIQYNFRDKIQFFHSQQIDEDLGKSLISKLHTISEHFDYGLAEPRLRIEPYGKNSLLSAVMPRKWGSFEFDTDGIYLFLDANHRLVNFWFTFETNPPKNVDVKYDENDLIDQAWKQAYEVYRLYFPEAKNDLLFSDSELKIYSSRFLHKTTLPTMDHKSKESQLLYRFHFSVDGMISSSNNPNLYYGFSDVFVYFSPATGVFVSWDCIM